MLLNISKSSHLWLHRKKKDPYIKLASKHGYRSRAAFKLLEIHNNDKLFKQGMITIDLGAAPGSWSQVAKKLVGPNGIVIAVDLLPMDAILGVDIIHGDFTSYEVRNKLIKKLQDNMIDLVISDISPNISGIKEIDLPRALYLSEISLNFVLKHLKNDGSFLVKMFQGFGLKEFMLRLHKCFKKVNVRKPKASRQESREIYILAQQFNRSIF